MQIANGSCQGTGAAIYVCLGFRPSKVTVFNMEDGGALSPEVIWYDQQRLVSGVDEGIKLLDTVARAEVTANGISRYDGGDVLHYCATHSRWEDASNNDATEVYVDGHYKLGAIGDTQYRCFGAAVCPGASGGEKVIATPGFCIGTDGDLNVNDELMTWEALGE